MRYEQKVVVNNCEFKLNITGIKALEKQAIKNNRNTRKVVDGLNKQLDNCGKLSLYHTLKLIEDNDSYNVGNIMEEELAEELVRKYGGYTKIKYDDALIVNTLGYLEVIDVENVVEIAKSYIKYIMNCTNGVPTMGLFSIVDEMCELSELIAKDELYYVLKGTGTEGFLKVFLDKKEKFTRNDNYRLKYVLGEIELITEE